MSCTLFVPVFQFQVGSSAGGVNYSVCLCPSSKCAHASLVQLTPHGRVVLGNFTKLMVLPNGESQVLLSDGDLCEGTCILYLYILVFVIDTYRCLCLSRSIPVMSFPVWFP